MGWYINLYHKVPYIYIQVGAIYGHAIEVRTKRQHSRNLGYGGVTNRTLRSKNQLLQQQPHAHGVAGCCFWGAGLLLGGRIVAWCSVQKEGNVRVPSLAEKPVCIQFLRAYTEIGDAETQSPGMLQKPEYLPYPCPRPKKFKGLATRDTLHGSRPNLRQRDCMG